MQRHAIASVVVTYGDAFGVCESSSSTSRPYISYERCGAMPSRRMCRAVQRFAIVLEEDALRIPADAVVPAGLTVFLAGGRAPVLRRRHVPAASTRQGAATQNQ